MSNGSAPTRALQLVELKFGKTPKALEDHVRALRRDGASWYTISRDIADRTKVVITPETARKWWVHLDGMDRGGNGNGTDGTS